MNWTIAIITGVAASAGMFWWVYRQDKSRLDRYRFVPATLRALSAFILVLLLLAPFIVTSTVQEVRPSLTILADRSASMNPHFAGEHVYRDDVERIVQQLSDRYDVDIVGWGDGLAEGKDSLWTAWHHSSQMGLALHQLLERQKVQPVQSVLLLSDGISNMGNDPVVLAQQLPFPVHSLVVGDSTTPVDVGIQNVLVNKTVSLNATFEMLIDVFAHKVQGREVNVNILHNGKSVFSQSVKVVQQRQVVDFSLQLQARQPGLQKYTIEITAVEGEQNIRNNRQDVYVDVVDEKIKVLLLAAGPHPDITALRSALQGLEQFEVTLVKTLTGAELRQCDIVIAHTPDAAVCNQLKMADKPVWYILGAGTGAQVFAALELLDGSGGLYSSVEVLPVLNGQFGIFQLPENIAEVVTKYPPLQGTLVNIKPQEDVLFHQRIGNVVTRQPLWFFKQYGTAATVILAGEGFWKWRMQEHRSYGKSETFEALVKQSLLKIHSRQDKRPFMLYTDKQVYNAYEKVYVYAMYKNALGELQNMPDVKLLVNGNARQKPMERIGNTYKEDMGIFEEGSYTVTGTIREDGREHTAVVRFEVAPFDLEAVRTHADYTLMNNIATYSGGLFGTYGERDAFVQKILQHATASVKLREETKEHQLVDFKWLFFLLLVLMAGEWLFRKNYNI